MDIINSIDKLIIHIKHWKLAGLTVALVPTMGNLHKGHLKLISEAKLKADKVVVSIFINPTQFGVNEDFDNYPRTEEQDTALLITQKVDVLFLPAVSEIYYPDTQTTISVSQLSKLHCGLFRAGHFEGVATVVCKLFNIVQPNVAFFGEKDYQQLMLIRIMVRDLNIPVKIYSVETVREQDGLAMSSRNHYLTTEQRQIAPKLYQALSEAKDMIEKNLLDFQQIEQQQRSALQKFGFNLDYFSICRSDNLLPAKSGDTELIILTAARLDALRLIDNIRFKIKVLTVDSL